MVDDTQYVIVPNKLKKHTSSNVAGEYVASLVKEGYRITHKSSNRDSIHYVLIKFKPGTKPERIGE